MPANDTAAAQALRLEQRLQQIAQRLLPCPVPDVADGWDLCAHGLPWPCPSTEAAWLARGLDPAEQARAQLAWLRGAAGPRLHRRLRRCHARSGREHPMTFRRNNRFDAEFELDPARVVELLQASTYWRADWPLERIARAFITDTDGPISAVWDDDAAFEEIPRLSRDAGWAHGA